jgi:hypothetical protein
MLIGLGHYNIHFLHYNVFSATCSNIIHCILILLFVVYFMFYIFTIIIAVWNAIALLKAIVVAIRLAQLLSKFLV